MRILLLIAAALLIVAPAQATVSTYGWEDGGTILGTNDPTYLAATNVGAPDPVQSGLSSLKLVDSSVSTTPQAYIAWVRGLADGMMVTATFWTYDTTTGSPSTRIWAHYNDSPTDPLALNGSAGGSATYSGSTGWTNLTTYTWTMAGGHTGLMIECRTYNNAPAAETLWLDDIEVIHPDGTTCTFPEPASPVESSTWTNIKALYR